MKRCWFFKTKGLLFSTLSILLLVAVACGSSAEPPPRDAAAAPPQSGASGGGAAKPSAAATPTAAPAVAAAPSSGAVAEAVGVLRIANKDLGPPQFLPKNMAVPQATYVSPVIFDALWKMSPDAELQNDLLEDWSLSPDGTTWTLKFRENIPFHKDWGNVTVHDFLWVVDQVQLEEARHPAKTHMRRIMGRDDATINIINDYTLEINTGSLQAYDFTWRFRQFGANNFPPLASKKYFEAVGEEKATLEGIGTGPWQFVEFRTNERFISEAVEDHWDKTPYFKELHYFQIAEESTRIANFLAGELDTMQTSLGSIPALLDAPGVKFMRFPGALELHITLHGQLYIPRPEVPERDVSLPWISASADVNSAEWERARKVREALMISIDRESIVDNVLEGEGHADNPYWRWTGYERFFDDEMKNTSPEYDPERARRLLQEADYGDGFEIDMALTQRSYPGTPLVGEAVCVQWEEIDVRCRQEQMPMTAFRPHFVNRTWKGYNTHDNSPSDEPINAYAQGVSSQGLIMRGMEHPWLDEKVDAILNEPNFDQRMELQREVAKFILKNAVHFPIASINVVWPVGPEIDIWNFGCCARDIASNLEYVPHRDQFGGQAYP